MKLFDFLNKNKKENLNDVLSGKGLVQYIQSNISNPTEKNVLKVLETIAKPDDDMEHLTAEGELPWGWHSQNKDFTSKIESEYSYFLNMWLDARNKAPKELHSALKSFILYLEDVESLCKSKGECFEFWFYEILTTPEYIEKRKEEFAELSDCLEEKQELFLKRQTLLCDLETRIIEKLIEHEGILQTEFVKLFDPIVQNDIKDKLYFLSKDEKIERIKSGRSYTLHNKG